MAKIIKNFLILFLLTTMACTNELVEKDHRQIVSKNEVRKTLPAGAQLFDISEFGEDTLSSSDTPPLRHIRYRIKFHYEDVTGKMTYHTAQVLFTPDGKSVTKTEILDGDSTSN